MDITITENRRDGAVVIGLRGRVHGGNADTFEERLVGLIEGGEHRLALDCTGFDYVSSAGVRAMIVVAKKLKDAGGKIALFGVNQNVRDVLDITGLLDIFPMYEDEDAAVKAVR